MIAACSLAPGRAAALAVRYRRDARKFVRSAAKELFAGQAGRNYWRRVGQHRLDLATRRRLKFAHILDGACQEAIKDPVAAPEGSRALQNPA